MAPGPLMSPLMSPCGAWAKLNGLLAPFLLLKATSHIICTLFKGG